MLRIQLSLLTKTVLMLMATGLLPIAISFYQLRANKDALREQVHRTHMVATRTTASRISALVEGLRSQARSVATNPVLYTSARSPAAAELLRGTLYAQQRIAAVAVFNSAGESVLLARRPEWREELAAEAIYDAEAPPAGVFRLERRWLRIREPLPEQLGDVVLVASVEDLGEEIAANELGDEAYLALATLDGEVLFGPESDLSAFPEPLRELALSGNLRSGNTPATEEAVGAFALVPALPWAVLSRQSARVVNVAREQIRRATWVAVILALALTLGISAGANATVVRPLRRLLHAQQGLIGERAASGGSEIAQLEASFAILEQRVRDREKLDKVFLGRYQVVDVLGSGAMGTVFKGYDPKLERPLALKTIRLASEPDRREKLITALRREAVTSAGFSHPNIVTVYDMADEGKAAFIAMEFVDGVTLEQLVAAQGRLDWRQAVLVAGAVARALEAAHEHGRVHQDVKPANLLLGRDHSIKVSDFGISQAITAANPSRDTICGTPGYIAPESLEGAGYSPRSDLFALGVLLHEALTGEHPFAAKNLRLTVMNTLYHDPPPIDRVYPDVPEALSKIVAQLIEKDPAKRPQAAAEVARRCERMAARLELEWQFEELPWALPERSELVRTQMVTLHSTRLAGTQAEEAGTRQVEADFATRPPEE